MAKWNSLKMSVTHSFELGIFCTVLALSLPLQATAAQQPNKFITSFSHRISARTLLFDCDAGNILCNRLIKQLKMPRLRISTNCAVKLRSFYNANSLAVVILERNEASYQEHLIGLQRTLFDSHNTHILFIDTKQPLMSQTRKMTLSSWHWLFEWCWSNGFLNVLVLESWKETNRTADKLITYTPFPSLDVHYTTFLNYLRLRKRIINFQGAPITVGVGNNPPRALVYNNNQGKLEYRGMVPAVLRLFAWRSNATLEFVEVKVPPNNTFEPKYCVNMLAKRQFDLCADLFVNTGSTSVSRSVFLYEGYLLVRYAQPIARYRYFFTPFSPDVWKILVATYAFVIAVIAVISRLQCGVWHFEYFSLNVIGSLLQVPFKFSLIHGRVKPLLRFLLAICGFVISSIYLTYLSSILTTEIRERQIESFEDLHKLNISVLITASDKKVLTDFGIPKIVQELFEIRSRTEIKATRDSLDPRHAQLMFFDKCLMHSYRQRFLTRPHAKRLDISVATASVGIPMKNNWPFEEFLDIHLLLIFDYGFYMHAFRESLAESIKHGNFSTFKTEYREWAPLNMEYFEVPALLLGCGYTMALVSFLGENMLH
ncbi:uncharacterized protein [Bactrocera oleae]|uniref:uncharacterized protein n=1 Tax=Bactrocera oleae TaxID=104688 RepID=UPI00387E5A6B